MAAMQFTVQKMAQMQYKLQMHEKNCANANACADGESSNSVMAIQGKSEVRKKAPMQK